MKIASKLNTTLFHTGFVSLALCLAIVGTPAQAGQAGPFAGLANWQNNRLLQPTPRQRAQEAQGKVVIYDGLSDRTVEKALDQNFDRIQNMMFIRVIRTGKGGQPLRNKAGLVLVEDDDC